jgi:Tfp pilus assembly protein PilO
MTTRDRMVLIGILVLAALGAGWILVVSPEREEASKLGAQVTSAQSSLTSAEGELAHARSDQAQYASAYASVVSLGKAVPPVQEVPSLIYQLSAATNQRNIEFSSITSNASSAGASSSSSTSATSSATSAAAVAPAAFTQMPFTFVFNGSFFDLEHLFHQLDGFASVTASGQAQVSGRLLTIQSVKLSPQTSQGTGAAATSKSSGELSGTITATAYELPAGQGLTGATAAPSATTPALAPTGSSSPTAPAIARVTP